MSKFMIDIREPDGDGGYYYEYRPIEFNGSIDDLKGIIEGCFMLGSNTFKIGRYNFHKNAYYNPRYGSAFILTLDDWFEKYK